MTFELICVSLLAIMFGLVLAFQGYTFFLVLLSVWGFIFGFGFGAQSVQYIGALIGSPDVGFLTTVISWLVGLGFAFLFALLAYYFYLFAVGILAASVGYLIGFGIMSMLGVTGWLAWLVAIVVGFVVAFAVLRLNVQKYVVILFTAFLGAGISIFGLLLPFGAFSLTDFASGTPLKSFMARADSWLWILLFLGMFVLAAYVQIRATRKMGAMGVMGAVEPEPGPGMAEAVAQPERMAEMAPAVEAVAAPIAAAAVVAAVVADAPAEPEPEPVVEPVVEAVAEAPVEVAAGAAAVAAVEAEMEPEKVEVAPVETEEAVEDPAAGIEIPTLDLDDEQRNFLNRQLEQVEGIGPGYAEKLNAQGLFKVMDLLSVGATRKGRQKLAETTEISDKLILKWVNRADLFRIRGVSTQYSDLLEAAGVDTVVELGTRNPTNLQAKLTEVNEEKSLVRLVPSLVQVEAWVEHAKSLPRVVSY